LSLLFMRHGGNGNGMVMTCHITSCLAVVEEEIGLRIPGP